MVRLQRVGNWASANALGPCIGAYRPSNTSDPLGIHRITRDAPHLLITLSSLTHHLITDLYTSPKLGSMTDSLRLSLASRDAFLESAFESVYARDRSRSSPKEGREISACAIGWTAMGNWDHVFAWVVE